MKTSGSFVSEAYRDGRTYFFEAVYSPRRWSAQIWDCDGQARGCISCLPLKRRLHDELLEDAVCDWVHKAIAHEVGVLLDDDDETVFGLVAEREPEAAPVPIALTSVNPTHAANAAVFETRRPTVRYPGRAQLELRGKELRRESRKLMDRFLKVSRDWQKSRPVRLRVIQAN